MNDFRSVQEKANDAYSEVIGSGGTLSQAAVAYLVTSKAEQSGDESRVQAARYVTLHQVYLNKPRRIARGQEFTSLERRFHGMGWNYSAVERFARTGENAHTKTAASADGHDASSVGLH